MPFPDRSSGAMPITVTGGNSVGNVKTARINGGTGAVQWARYNATTGAYISDIVGATALTYRLSASDEGFSIRAYTTSYQPVSSATPAVSGDSSYARWRAAQRAVLGGTSNAKVGLVGDSTTAGFGANNVLAGSRALGPVIQLRNALALLTTMPLNTDGWFGDQSVFVTNGGSIATYDPRVTTAAGWNTTNASIRTAGGSLQSNTSNTNILGFLPTGQVDTFEVRYAINTGLGSFQASRTGDASSGVISQAGTSGIGKLTFSGALGNTNPLNISRVAGGAYIMSVDSWNSAVKSMRILNIGWNGGKVSDWIANTGGFDSLPALADLSCNLYVIQPGINDAINGTPIETYRTQLTTLVTTLLAVGDVLLSTHYPSNTSIVSAAIQDQYVQVLKDVAAAFNLRVHDVYAQFGSWAAANAAGYMFDNLHPNLAGYQAAMNTRAPLMLGL